MSGLRVGFPKLPEVLRNSRERYTRIAYSPTMLTVEDCLRVILMIPTLHLPAITRTLTIPRITMTIVADCSTKLW